MGQLSGARGPYLISQNVCFLFFSSIHARIVHVGCVY